jgi:ElaB/YqjD/DUF883 family membrane-anchored ribosome-binding protein
MEIRRKVFSLLQDENGEERYYSTNEFEISYDEETGEKMFSEVGNKVKEITKKVGDAAGKGFVWMKDKAGNWVKVAKSSIKEAAGKVAEGTKEVAGKVADVAKTAADKVAEGAKVAANKVAEGAKAGAGKVAEGAKAGAAWAKAHPKTAIGIGVGAAAASAGAAIGAKQLKAKKENK